MLHEVGMHYPRGKMQGIYMIPACDAKGCNILTAVTTHRQHKSAGGHTEADMPPQMKAAQAHLRGAIGPCARRVVL